MKIKKWDDFGKLYEYTNVDYRDDMEKLSEEIAERGDTCFYVIRNDGKYVSVGKYAITETMRNGFQDFFDQGMECNIYNIGEFIQAFANDLGGEALLEHEAKGLLESLQNTINGEADTEYLEDFPELEMPLGEEEKEYRKKEKEDIERRQKEIDEEERKWREEQDEKENID